MARRKKVDWSGGTYAAAARVASTRGSATYEGEQRTQKGLGLDPLVDPKTHGCKRQAFNLLVPQPDGSFKLPVGVAMPVKSAFDTTGSMGHNVDIAFQVLPKVQSLLVQSVDAVLSRYHVQIATALIQDVVDRYAHEHTEFEPDNEVERQMSLLSPDRSGGDSTEDYQLDLWYTARRIETSIVRYGLKGYYFVIGDECGRNTLDSSTIKKIYGVDEPQSASVEEVAQEALRSWHAFFLQVGSHRSHAISYWSRAFGPERVVMLPRTEDIAEVEAVVIGLTEGVIDPQTAADLLASAKVGKENARQIVRAVSHIPLRAQADLPNFNRVPKPGDVFESREAVWPMGSLEEAVQPSKPGEINWQL